MALSYATQRRTVTVNGVVAAYNITTTITDQGDLPTAACFVNQIIEDDDPKQDTLLRVATVADIIDIPQDRPTALALATGIYRVETTSQSYADINAANAAALFLQEKLNALVTEYQLYLTEFEADPAAVLVFPQGDAGVLAPLIQAYTDKVEEITTATAALAATQAACAVTEANATAAAQRADDLLAARDAQRASSDAMSEAAAGIATARAAEANTAELSAALLEVYDAERGPIPAGPQAALDFYLLDTTGLLAQDYVTQLATLGALATVRSGLLSALTDSQAAAAQLSSDYITAKAELTALNAAITACQLEIVTQQGVIDELERQRDALLGSILELCPDYSVT